jgi:putative transposase
LVENGGMKKQYVQLTPADRETLEGLIRKGKQSAKAYRRALGLLELDRVKTYTAVSQTMQVSIPTLSNWAALYKEKDLKVLLEKPRSGRPIQIDGEQRAKITALPSSEPPEGYARWSLRLLADKAVGLGYFEYISYTVVTEFLKKKRTETPSQTDLVYWETGQPFPRADGTHFGVLCVTPYDPAYSVVCYDERLCFLIGDQIEPVSMQTRQVRKEHYAYE